MDAPRAPHRREWLFAALLLIPLALAQAGITAASPVIGVDGGYYTDVALHVRDGDGLVADVSLYHAGFEHFPHPTPIYPLWPLLFGLLLRLGPVEPMAHWVPYGLYLLSLGAAYLAGRSLIRGPLLGVKGLHGGHLLALMLGVQREYSKFATRPYTETLAFLLLMITLWRATRLGPKPGWGRLIELGGWMALCCLCRSQNFIVPMAAGLSFGVLGIWGLERRRWWLGGAASLSVVAAALAAWWASCRDSVVDAGLFTLLRFDQAQANHILSPINVIKDSRGPLDLLLDRLAGVLVAYDPFDWDGSYAHGFYTMQWALPVAILVALPLLFRLRWTAIRDLLRRPDAFPWLFVGLLALGGLASVHLPHKDGFGDWYFHRRHAIICVFAFYLSTAFLLLRPRRFPRLLGLTAVFFVFWFGVDSFYWRNIHLRKVAPNTLDEPLVEWLQDRVERQGPTVVALQAFKPPEFAWRTEGVGYHWFYERTSLEDLTKMFDQLGAEFLIYRDRATVGWDFQSDRQALYAAFMVLDVHPGSYRVLRRRRPAPE